MVSFSVRQVRVNAQVEQALARCWSLAVSTVSCATTGEIVLLDWGQRQAWLIRWLAMRMGSDSRWYY